MTTLQWTKRYRCNDISQAHQATAPESRREGTFYRTAWLFSLKSNTREAKLRLPCSRFHREPNQKAATPDSSCVPVWRWEASQGTRSVLLSERKLANLENSDVKTTFVEQTVPQRHREWWKEKESTITAYEAHCAGGRDEREMLSVYHSEAGRAHTTRPCTLRDTKTPQSWTELNEGIAGSSRLEMRWESGRGDKESVALFISLVRSWVGQGWRGRQMTGGGREVTREGAEGWRGRWSGADRWRGRRRRVRDGER